MKAKIYKFGIFINVLIIFLLYRIIVKEYLFLSALKNI